MYFTNVPFDACADKCLLRFYILFPSKFPFAGKFLCKWKPCWRQSFPYARMRILETYINDVYVRHYTKGLLTEHGAFTKTERLQRASSVLKNRSPIFHSTTELERSIYCYYMANSSFIPKGICYVFVNIYTGDMLLVMYFILACQWNFCMYVRKAFIFSKI